MSGTHEGEKRRERDTGWLIVPAGATDGAAATEADEPTVPFEPVADDEEPTNPGL